MSCANNMKRRISIKNNEKKRKSPSDNKVHVIKALWCVRFFLSPLFLAEVGSRWAGHRRSQLGNLLSDWFVRWHRVPNQSWAPARRCPGPTGSGLPSWSSETWTLPQLWGKKTQFEVKWLTGISSVNFFLLFCMFTQEKNRILLKRGWWKSV